MNTMEHERMRFDTMTEKQLATRLNKITDPVKLGNFMRVAQEKHLTNLFTAAKNRRDSILGIVPNRVTFPSPLHPNYGGQLKPVQPPPLKPIPVVQPIIKEKVFNYEEEVMGKRKLKL